MYRGVDMFTYIKKHWNIGKQIYGTHSWREFRRDVLHTMRVLRHKKEMLLFENYFNSYTADPTLLKRQPGLYELMSRTFLYKDSTPKSRLKDVCEHFDYLDKIFTSEAIQSIYIDEQDFDYYDKNRGILLFSDESLNINARLYFEPGQRKEGLMTILLQLESQGIYHANIRYAKGLEGEDSLIIGTIQGYKDGLENAKYITKKMFGYRPKNFIVFLCRQLAIYSKVRSIYAISDEGFYANNHLIRGHKSKVAELNPVWEESGGKLCSDKRFYNIPLEEVRKSIEEIKSQKRSQYRKRYDLLDQYAEEVQENLKPYLK